MKRFMLVAVAMASLLLFGVSAVVAAPAVHLTQELTGDTLQCGDTTYTVVSGEVAIVMHEGTTALGNTNFTGTITPRHVVLQDQAGNLYSVAGATWFGETSNANTGGFQATSTDKLQIVSQGRGTVDGGQHQRRGAREPQREGVLLSASGPARGEALRGSWWVGSGRARSRAARRSALRSS